MGSLSGIIIPSLLACFLSLASPLPVRAFSSLKAVVSSSQRVCSERRLRSHHDDVACRMTNTADLEQQPREIEHQQEQPVGNILILDHLNINHEKGRHDWLKAFYFDFLQCAVDPRKQENMDKGSKTLWANIGAHQFHLPEGKPEAQVLQGMVTLVYPNLDGLLERYRQVQPALEGSLFKVVAGDNDNDGSTLQVTDPWGTQFRFVQGEAAIDGDRRGKQPGGVSEGLAIRDLTLYTKKNANMEGIARFYNQVLGAPTLECTADKTVVSVGPFQTLTFMTHPSSSNESNGMDHLHDDLRDDHVEPPPGFPTFLSNYGPHISMYVADLADSYAKANDLNLVYVNPRFKRRAYTLDEAVDDCMFRCLDIVDPENPEDGVILQLEHEVRSVVKRDGSMYRSCPFDEIPAGCVSRSQ